MKPRVSSWTSEQCVGDVLVEFSSRLKSFVNYFQSYACLLVHLERCREQFPAFRTLLRRRERSADTNMLTWDRPVTVVLPRDVYTMCIVRHMLWPGDRYCVVSQRHISTLRIFIAIKDGTKVTAVADRPARHRGSVHAKYSVSHDMVIKPFLLLSLAAEYRSRPWVWSTVVRRPSHVYNTVTQQNLNGSRDLTTTT